MSTTRTWFAAREQVSDRLAAPATDLGAVREALNLVAAAARSGDTSPDLDVQLTWLLVDTAVADAAGRLTPPAAGPAETPVVLEGPGSDERAVREDVQALLVAVRAQVSRLLLARALPGRQALTVAAANRRLVEALDLLRRLT